MVELATSCAGLVIAVFIDALARPRRTGFRLRIAPGLWLLSLQVVALFGLCLGVCGNPLVAVALTLALLALLVVASNAKQATLGEPLVFSDLALVGAIFRHPQFYLSAVPLWHRMVAAIVAAVLTGVIAALFVTDPAAHGWGMLLLAAALAALETSLRVPPWRGLAATPDNDADVQRLGLTPTLMLYWRRWRHTEDPPACPPAPNDRQTRAPHVLVVVQCESFADSVELFGRKDLVLPGLAAARAMAWQHGRLLVSGFGAYTMRTEYGVLFGRDEQALGFRRYDPFLTALGEVSHALPARLGRGWRSLFLHPHDMRFYGRDRIMPAAGFGELIGEERFAAPAADEGRYVTDAAMTDRILDLARAADRPTMLYAVTIENHGPWAPDPATGATGLVASYMRLVSHSDAMLSRLVTGLGALDHPATLVFFGDHRPSIPGATDPAGARHTPYVVLRFAANGTVVQGRSEPDRSEQGRSDRVDLTPAGLHHAILSFANGTDG